MCVCVYVHVPVCVHTGNKFQTITYSSLWWDKLQPTAQQTNHTCISARRNDTTRTVPNSTFHLQTPVHTTHTHTHTTTSPHTRHYVSVQLNWECVCVCLCFFVFRLTETRQSQCPALLSSPLFATGHPSPATNPCVLMLPTTYLSLRIYWHILGCNTAHCWCRVRKSRASGRRQYLLLYFTAYEGDELVKTHHALPEIPCRSQVVLPLTQCSAACPPDIRNGNTCYTFPSERRDTTRNKFWKFMSWYLCTHAL